VGFAHKVEATELPRLGSGVGTIKNINLLINTTPALRASPLLV
jgi:hypothetical protein